jgi:hypothetical protein
VLAKLDHYLPLDPIGTVAFINCGYHKADPSLTPSCAQWSVSPAVPGWFAPAAESVGVHTEGGVSRIRRCPRLGGLLNYYVARRDEPSDVRALISSCRSRIRNHQGIENELIEGAPAQDQGTNLALRQSRTKYGRVGRIVGWAERHSLPVRLLLPDTVWTSSLPHYVCRVRTPGSGTAVAPCRRGARIALIARCASSQSVNQAPVTTRS